MFVPNLKKLSQSFPEIRRMRRTCMRIIHWPQICCKPEVCSGNRDRVKGNKLANCCCRSGLHSADVSLWLMVHVLHPHHTLTWTYETEVIGAIMHRTLRWNRKRGVFTPRQTRNRILWIRDKNCRPWSSFRSCGTGPTRPDRRMTTRADVGQKAVCSDYLCPTS